MTMLCMSWTLTKRSILAEFTVFESHKNKWTTGCVHKSSVMGQGMGGPGGLEAWEAWEDRQDPEGPDTNHP